MSDCYWCPFSGCEDCRWRGGDTLPRQGAIPGLTCDNSGTTKAAPAGNRGLTTTTIKESNDGCF